jgi:hypothetical protein
VTSSEASSPLSNSSVSTFTRIQPLHVVGVEPTYSNVSLRASFVPPPRPSATTNLPQQRVMLDSPRRAANAAIQSYCKETSRLKREALE